MASFKETTSPQGRSLVRALDVLDAIGQAGLVVVPLEPSEDMVLMAARAGGVTEDAARRIYRMLVSADE